MCGSLLPSCQGCALSCVALFASGCFVWPYCHLAPPNNSTEEGPSCASGQPPRLRSSIVPSHSALPLFARSLPLFLPRARRSTDLTPGLRPSVSSSPSPPSSRALLHAGAAALVGPVAALGLASVFFVTCIPLDSCGVGPGTSCAMWSGSIALGALPKRSPKRRNAEEG